MLCLVGIGVEVGVVGFGEAVGFVSKEGDEEAGVMGGEEVFVWFGVLTVGFGDNEAIGVFGQAYDGDVPLVDFENLVDLGEAAVKKDEVGRGPFGVVLTPFNHVGHHGGVVGSLRQVNFKAAVVIFGDGAVLKDYHGAGGMGALEIRDVVEFYAMKVTDFLLDLLIEPGLEFFAFGGQEVRFQRGHDSFEGGFFEAGGVLELLPLAF